MTLTLLTAYLKRNILGRTSLYTPKISLVALIRSRSYGGWGAGTKKKPGLDGGGGVGGAE